MRTENGLLSEGIHVEGDDNSNWAHAVDEKIIKAIEKFQV